jgi:hypothetical protein
VLYNINRAACCLIDRLGAGHFLSEMMGPFLLLPRHCKRRVRILHNTKKGELETPTTTTSSNASQRAIKKSSIIMANKNGKEDEEESSMMVTRIHLLWVDSEGIE